MKNKRKSIFIATPMYGGMCYGAYSKSLFNTMKTLLDNGFDVQFRDLYNDSVISTARNTLTGLFLKSECDYLLFIDADQTFKPEDILRMINEDKDVLGAVIPKKQMNWNSVKEAVNQNIQTQMLELCTGVFNIAGSIDQNTDFNKPFEVSHVGTGMMLIKRQVFEKLMSVVDSYKYTDGSVQGLSEGEKMYEFWKITVYNEIITGEDVYFCKLWQNIGGKVYAVAYPRVSHIGMYEFKGSLAI